MRHDQNSDADDKNATWSELMWLLIIDVMPTKHSNYIRLSQSGETNLVVLLAAADSSLLPKKMSLSLSWHDFTWFRVIAYTWDNDTHFSQGVSFCRPRLPVKGRFWKSLKLTFKREISRNKHASYESNRVQAICASDSCPVTWLKNDQWDS